MSVSRPDPGTEPADDPEGKLRGQAGEGGALEIA